MTAAIAPSVTVDDLAWQEQALCGQTDPEAFYPEKGGSTRAAKRVCLVCDVRSECLEYALAHDERFGIWGGLSERELRKLRTERRAANSAATAASRVRGQNVKRPPAPTGGQTSTTTS